MTTKRNKSKLGASVPKSGSLSSSVNILGRRGSTKGKKRTCRPGTCFQCGCPEYCTQMWRTIPGIPRSQGMLCNACGLWYKEKGYHRPAKYWKWKKSPEHLEAMRSGRDRGAASSGCSAGSSDTASDDGDVAMSVDVEFDDVFPSPTVPNASISHSHSRPISPRTVPAAPARAPMLAPAPRSPAFVLGPAPPRPRPHAQRTYSSPPPQPQPIPPVRRHTVAAMSSAPAQALGPASAPTPPPAQLSKPIKIKPAPMRRVSPRPAPLVLDKPNLVTLPKPALPVTTQATPAAAKSHTANTETVASNLLTFFCDAWNRHHPTHDTPSHSAPSSPASPVLSADSGPKPVCRLLDGAIPKRYVPAWISGRPRTPAVIPPPQGFASSSRYWSSSSSSSRRGSASSTGSAEPYSRSYEDRDRERKRKRTSPAIRIADLCEPVPPETELDCPPSVSPSIASISPGVSPTTPGWSSSPASSAFPSALPTPTGSSVYAPSVDSRRSSYEPTYFDMDRAHGLGISTKIPQAHTSMGYDFSAEFDRRFRIERL